MYTAPEIFAVLKIKKAELEKQYPISEMGLYGSYANGNYNEHSDIDILVEDEFYVKIVLVSHKGIKSQYIPFVEKSLIHV